ncbi:MAG: hypothetical protein H0X25_07375 [Acidobacteriales bacterium]|nr:hypothetical protein [Terriglobales bacterium]
MLVKCRQIGASHTYAAAALLWALLGENTSIVSIGERESSDVLKKVTKHSQALSRLGSRWAVAVSNTTTRIEIVSGGAVTALPSTTGGRGQSGNVLLDEAAYYQRPDEVWDGASATAMHGYRIRVMSTPNGVGNMFEKLYRSHAKAGFKLHEVNLSDALADGLRVKESDCWALAKNDPRIFDQLFNCSFLDGAFQYIPTTDFVACFGNHEPLVGGSVYAGLDIGETRDKTVLVVVRRRGNRRQLLHIESYGKTDDSLIDELVRKAIEQFKCSLVCADSTGLGRFPAQRLAERWGRKFEGVDFTLKSKEDMATGLYDAVAKHELELPNGYISDGIDEMPLLRDDVYAIRREVTSSGNVRYVAARSEKGHADRAWSLMLALHAAGSMSPMFAALQG